MSQPEYFILYAIGLAIFIGMFVLNSKLDRLITWTEKEDKEYERLCREEEKSNRVEGDEWKDAE